MYHQEKSNDNHHIELGERKSSELVKVLDQLQFQNKRHNEMLSGLQFFSNNLLPMNTASGDKDSPLPQQDGLVGAIKAEVDYYLRMNNQVESLMNHLQSIIG